MAMILEPNLSIYFYLRSSVHQESLKIYKYKYKKNRVFITSKALKKKKRKFALFKVKNCITEEDLYID